MTPQARHIAPTPKPSTYIEGIGWRHSTEHSMTRWPHWKDSRKPGTYMLTLKVNGNQKLLGTLKGCTTAVYRWMKANEATVTSASHDELYYRHALLGTSAMPFVVKQEKETLHQANTTGVETPVYKDGEAQGKASSGDGVSTPVKQSSCSGVSTPSNAMPVNAKPVKAKPSPIVPSAHHGKPRTHFPLEALRQPDAPHIELTPLGEAVKAAWERMPEVEPQIEPVCLAIMPNHIHAIIAVRSELSRPIGSVIRSFMGATTHALHKMIANGNVQWKPSPAGVETLSLAGVKTPAHKDKETPSATPQTEPSAASTQTAQGTASTQTAPSAATTQTAQGATPPQTAPSAATTQTAPSAATTQTAPSEAPTQTAQGEASSCDGVSTPSNAPHQKPSLWQPGYCIGICQTEQKLHTRIGYVLENPFFGIMEKEQPLFMERTMLLAIGGRRYRAYGNMLLLKEPDRMQVFCHRQHPTTRQPYHLTQDFQEHKTTVLDAAADGVVIVTPGISPGEAEIMWAVLRAGGNVINIQKDIPLDDKWHPDKERRLYCQRGQLLVLAAHDLPENEYRDWQGNVIPSGTKYSQFHNLNAIAQELCQEGIEHECKARLIKPTS